MREESKGWVCPDCGRGIAPYINSCDHGTMPYSQIPALPSPIYPKLTWHTDCGCPPNSNCGNAACPRRHSGINTCISTSKEELT